MLVAWHSWTRSRDNCMESQQEQMLLLDFCTQEEEIKGR